MSKTAILAASQLEAAIARLGKAERVMRLARSAQMAGNPGSADVREEAVVDAACAALEVRTAVLHLLLSLSATSTDPVVAGLVVDLACGGHIGGGLP